jgi:3-hydroxybutyryl-CoA dehydratase
MNWSAPFEELEQGTEFTTLGRTVTEADVVAFAALTGDMHPQHVDASWAANGPFGERVAHGMLLLSYAVGLIPFDPARVLALRGVGNAVFKRPVLLGDTITVAGRLAGLTPVDDACGLVRCRLTISNQRRELCCRAETELLWRRQKPEV